MPFYGTVLGKQKITLCFASYPSCVGKWGVPQFALPIARRSWQTVCQNIPWPFSICRLTKWGHKYMNSIPRTARRVTWWAFDRFIWVKRSSYHIYIGYRNLKCPHGNLSKYKFGLAEYITVYVIQLQQLLQLLLRIITQYTKYVYFKFYKMFTECFWVISVLMLLLILLFI